ncbi:MAG TPA: addiction module toxin RelE [Vicinamibacteria bacterium]|nr:addiction module toxin RelE [Vicinamibacteria bacterium]
MAKRAYELIYDREEKTHLESIDRKFYSLIRDTLWEHLSHEPEVETRNRKPMRRPNVLGTEWELRFGPDNRFRAYYGVDASRREVHILAIGHKKGSSLYIGRSRFMK